MREHLLRHRFFWGFLAGILATSLLGLLPGMLGPGAPNSAEATAGKPVGRFVNLVTFSPIKPGKEAEFLEWFRWSNEVYAAHKGFISRTLLRPMDGKGGYAAIVEHDSKETFMAMHLSADREEAFKRVEPLLDGRPPPHFYEVVLSVGR